MALKTILLRAWSMAVSAAASECVNATLTALWKDDLVGGTAVDAKGNVWVTSFDETNEPYVVIWKCLEGGECAFKRTGEYMPLFLGGGSREIAVFASDEDSIIYLLIPQLEGPADMKKCVWHDDAPDQEISCSQWLGDGTNHHLALDKEGNVFLSYGTYGLQKCNAAGNCTDFGGDFWDSHRFSPNYVAFDSQGNLYVTRRSDWTYPDFSAGDVLVAKCTSSGECMETQITVPPSHAYAYFGYGEIAITADDYIYMMVQDRLTQWLIQCSPDSVCNQVVTFDDTFTMQGLSAGKHSDVYTVRLFRKQDGHHHPELIRLCVPPQISEIQA